MNQLVSTQALTGSQIQFRETNEELVFYLPPHAIRGWTRAVLFVAALVVWEGFWAGLAYGGEWTFLFIAVLAGILGLLPWGVCFYAFAVSDLTKTWVHFTPERLVLKTRVCGWDHVETYHLNKRSYAKQWWGRPNPPDSPDEPSGIVVTSDADSSLGKGTAHFGVSLSRRELDWVEWCIKRFLGHATDADAPEGVIASAEAAAALIEGVPRKPLAPPEDTKIRIDEDFFETRIHFPGTVAMGSYKGIGVSVFGFVWAGLPLSVLIDRWRYLPDADAWSLLDVGILVFLGVFGVLVVFGLLLLFMGLTRLFGCSRLTISPERIAFRTTLLGILPFYWKTLSTADVISVHSVKICTANRAISYDDQFRDAVRNEAEANWLAEEIALRIQAARSGASVPPIGFRS